MQRSGGGSPISHDEADCMSTNVVLSNSDDGALKRKGDFQEPLHEIKDDTSHNQCDILRSIDRMYGLIFPESNGVWFHEPNALPIVCKVIDALHVMIACMNEELLDMNEKMGQKANDEEKIPVVTQDERGNNEVLEDDEDLQKQDHIAYAALAAVREDDRKQDEALKQKAINRNIQKYELLKKTVGMVKATEMERDLADGGRGDYPTGIDMRVDAALFDRFNKIMVTSNWPVNVVQNGVEDHFSVFLVTLNMYTELLKRMDKYKECRKADKAFQPPLSKRTRLDEPTLCP